jgi:SAM-dependent methyltransferase
MNNYEFCVQWILDRLKEDTIEKYGNNFRVLDYGCGAGQIVRELRAHDVNAFGCDLFYEGGDYSKSIDPTLLNSAIIKKMEGNMIPFDIELTNWG